MSNAPPLCPPATPTYAFAVVPTTHPAANTHGDDGRFDTSLPAVPRPPTPTPTPTTAMVMMTMTSGSYASPSSRPAFMSPPAMRASGKATRSYADCRTPPPKRVIRPRPTA